MGSNKLIELLEQPSLSNLSSRESDWKLMPPGTIRDQFRSPPETPRFHTAMMFEGFQGVLIELP